MQLNQWGRFIFNLSVFLIYLYLKSFHNKNLRLVCSCQSQWAIRKTKRLRMKPSVMSIPSERWKTAGIREFGASTDWLAICKDNLLPWNRWESKKQDDFDIAILETWLSKIFDLVNKNKPALTDFAIAWTNDGGINILKGKILSKMTKLVKYQFDEKKLQKKYLATLTYYNIKVIWSICKLMIL